MSRREPRACPGGAMWASPPTKGQADLPHNDRRGRRPRRPISAAAPRCHSEPVTVSLAWESVLSFVGKRIAAPVCTPRALASRRGLARNDRVCRGRRPRRPVSAALPRWERIAAPVCGLARNDKVRRAGPMCPAAEHRICPGGAHGPRPTRRQHRFSA